MLQLLYILAFTILAFLAVGNLIRSLLTLGIEAQRTYSPVGWGTSGQPDASFTPHPQSRSSPHPELLDAAGNVINEPLLVMRSMTVEDARERLDALYEASPGYDGESRDE
ncbi:hypothetical protein DO97_16770 [Neosynechococcus sphagnicola sy1]|uniref:DUF2973 domain-containing protein n=1 Tax=Neosynechococcus sphagnicola sy1 TaxID=1497020 RepID=A0A098TSA3_9CYAN|nr:DUF2973 domain-containing protein [Neosynechococcus sphagnicola]KGF73623.1 hypothetical protein DO97_16770 [Neosynechococcus sphagnicola sy1]